MILIFSIVPLALGATTAALAMLRELEASLVAGQVPAGGKEGTWNV